MHQSMKNSIPLQPSQFLPTMYIAIEDLQCSICNCIVDQQWKHPVEGMCVHFVLSIFFIHVMTLPHFRAFCKEIYDIFDSSYPPVTEMVVKMLGELLLTCSSYKKKEGIGQENHLQVLYYTPQSFPFIIIYPILPVINLLLWYIIIVLLKIYFKATPFNRCVDSSLNNLPLSHKLAWRCPWHVERMTGRP